MPIPDLIEAVPLAPPAVTDKVSVLEDASHLGYNRQVEAQNRELNALHSEQAALKQLLKASPGVASSSTGGTTEPNDQPYGDMFFQGYGTNPFVDTEDDPQSTFGLDVDTASYTMARSYLRRGDLPPADAIRVEEFVNFFDYGDRAPRSRDFAVVAEGAPSPFASTARTYLLRFALKGREVSARQRKAAVLTFVVDVSGSMNRENRLGLVQRALGLLVQQLDEGDAIGLVVYGSHGQVILDPTSDHRRVMAAIEGLRPGGSTNVEEGLVLGYQTARRFFRPGAINRVILCSDGVANVGRTGPDSILARIEREADAGIELTTVGFGMGNYNDVLMEQLADKGDGNYAYVDDLDEARRVFVENLTGTLQTIAGDAKVQVEFDPRMVQSYRLLGYENRDIADRDFRNDAVDAGEIGAGHQVTALYEVKMRDARPKRGKIATLRLRYRSRRSGRVVEDAVDLQRSDLAGSWRGASRGLRLAAVAAEFAEVLRGSYWAREGDLRGLESRARGLARSGAWDSDIAELAELISTAARLAEASETPLGADGIEQ
ncbi:MAG: von Willebrand factor type A domain-containing protein [Acidobacteria bacterium]|nr:von Willebrand factor type A domain-containing protein [Acidobacteriota bacterium]